MRRDLGQAGLFLGLTLVAIGYFMVWLPHGAAGLSFTGLEMGEQAKFLPQVRSGEITPGRSLFYVPPVALGFILILLSGVWSMRRKNAWAIRLVGIAFTLLALPAFEAIGAQPEEWVWRVLMIAAVFVFAVVSPLLERAPQRLVWNIIVLVGLAGGTLPLWALIEVKDAFSHLFQTPIQIGAGAWLNLLGYLTVVVSAVVSRWR